MSEPVKILPAVMAALVILLGVKGVAVWTGVQAELLTISTAEAADSEDPSEDDKETASNVSQEDGGEQVEVSSATDDIVSGSSVIASGFMSETEIEVLQSLAARREALDKRGQELDLRENMLKATETRLDEKIAELKQIETHISDLLALRDKEEEEQIRSLVKVYETMKPKSAAKIFEDLDQDILLDVAGRMKEKNMAVILAAMSSEAAQALTVKLARRRESPGFTPTSPEQAEDSPEG